MDLFRSCGSRKRAGLELEERKHSTEAFSVPQSEAAPAVLGADASQVVLPLVTGGIGLLTAPGSKLRSSALHHLLPSFSLLCFGSVGVRSSSGLAGAGRLVAQRLSEEQRGRVCGSHLR